MKKILENIKAIRTKKSFSQEYMAEKLEMEQAGYGLIENGKRKLRYETLEQIAMIYQMPVIDIITWPDQYVKRDTDDIIRTPKVTLQIDLEDNIKADVIKLAFGDRVLEIINRT
jgi:transcriptional regulator with XRE-family HTH domain